MSDQSLGKQLKGKRGDLQQAIFDLVATFEKENDVSVTEIDLEHATALGVNQLRAVRVKVGL